MAVEEVSLQQLYESGQRHHQAGRIAEAEISYRKALALNPQFAVIHCSLALALQAQNKLAEAVVSYRQALALDGGLIIAHCNLGNILQMQGQLDEAVLCFRKALAINPAAAEIHFLLGATLKRQGELAAAIDSYRQAIATKPDFLVALINLANTLVERGDCAAAIDAYQRALALNPGLADVHSYLGLALKQQDRLDDAIASFQRAVALKPDIAELHANLAGALKERGRLDEALASYGSALRLRPDFAELHNDLANVLLAQHKFDEAIIGYRRAIALKPDLIIAHCSLGAALSKQGRHVDAIAIYRQVLASRPEHAVALNNLGVALQAQGDLREALGCYRRAVAAQADFIDAHNNIASALRDLGEVKESIAYLERIVADRPNSAALQNNLGASLVAAGRLREGVGHFRRALAIEPDDPLALLNLSYALTELSELQEAIACTKRALSLEPNNAAAFSTYLGQLQYLPDYAPADLFADHRAFAERFERPLRAHWPRHDNERDPQRRLRVGFVSGDFRAHPVGFFLENVLRHIDRQRWDVVLYSTNPVVDELTARLRALGFAWVSLVELSDDAAARHIRDDAIDILVDLSGHTFPNRLLLFARKPAPLQVAWLGYWATTGLQAIDYIFADRISIPADEVQFYSEQPLYLADTRLCFTPPVDNIAVAPLPALQRGHIIFGCFNNLAKMTDRVVAVWAQILNRIGNAQLFLKSKALADADMQRSVAARFAEHGIGAERLILEPPSARAEYLLAYQRIDIALDPFPFAGATTTIEGLWMGVPLITRRGDRMSAHQGEAILHNLSLADWIAADDDAYVELAVKRAADLTGVAQLRAGLRDKLLLSPLCSADVFAANLESAFREIWKKYCSRM